MMKEITDIIAISSREKAVKNFLISNIKADRVIEDNLGGVAFEFKGNKEGRVVNVVAHMDEVGFIVRTICDNGIIKVTNVGGITAETALSQRVILKLDNSEFEGVILNHSPHDKQSSIISIEELNIDFGFTSKENAVKLGVQIGDMITFKNDFQELLNNRIVTKAADNRLGCLSLVEIADEIGSNRDFSGTLILSASVQEEIGLRGAEAIVKSIEREVDNALIIDVSPVADLQSSDNGVVGGGTLIRIKDPSCMLDYEEIGVLRNLAEKFAIKSQSFFSKGGTDAAKIQIVDKGIKTVALCVPARNLHSNNTVFSKDDYEATVKLAIKYIENKLDMR